MKTLIFLLVKKYLKCSQRQNYCVTQRDQKLPTGIKALRSIEVHPLTFFFIGGLYSSVIDTPPKDMVFVKGAPNGTTLMKCLLADNTSFSSVTWTKSYGASISTLFKFTLCTVL